MFGSHNGSLTLNFVSFSQGMAELTEKNGKRHLLSLDVSALNSQSNLRFDLIPWDCT